MKCLGRLGTYPDTAATVTKSGGTARVKTGAKMDLAAGGRAGKLPGPCLLESCREPQNEIFPEAGTDHL